MRRNAPPTQRLLPALFVTALLALAPLAACGDDPARDPAACDGQAQCYDRACCGRSFHVCQSCSAGAWKWPVDDTCYFACRDAGGAGEVGGAGDDAAATD
jgi:hypothetical protein